MHNNVNFLCLAALVCCCKEMPSTTGWNHYIFTRTILESAKLFFLPVRTHFIQAYVVWNARIYSKRASVCCANWIALSVEGVYCMTELFWKQLLKEVRVKIILISSSHWWCFITATSATVIQCIWFKRVNPYWDQIIGIYETEAFGNGCVHIGTQVTLWHNFISNHGPIFTVCIIKSETVDPHLRPYPHTAIA